MKSKRVFVQESEEGVGPRGWRIVRGLSQEQAAELSGIARPTIISVEQGKGTSSSTLQKLAVAYQAGSVSALLAGPGQEAVEAARARNKTRIPVVMTVGVQKEELIMVPGFADVPSGLSAKSTSYLGEVEIPVRFLSHGHGAVFTITDDSMYPRFPRKTAVIVDTKTAKVRNGQAVWLVLDGTPLIRTFTREGETRIVKPENASYGPPIALDPDIEILGVVRYIAREEQF